MLEMESLRKDIDRKLLDDCIAGYAQWEALIKLVLDRCPVCLVAMDERDKAVNAMGRQRYCKFCPVFEGGFEACKQGNISGRRVREGKEALKLVLKRAEERKRYLMDIRERIKNGEHEDSFSYYYYEEKSLLHEG